MDLSGRLAIVTGGAVRIGRVIAVHLAGRGCDVVVHYHTSADEAERVAASVRETGRRAVTVSADLAGPTEATDRIFAAAADLGTPSLLVNSAAIFEKGTAEDTTDDSWDRHLAINLSAPFHLTRRFAKAAGGAGGCVVNIADWRAERHPAGNLAYTVSKSGLFALTRVAAQDLAPRIRVNAIAPGPILPPPGMPESVLEPVIASLPMKRQGTPEEIARAVAYLAESEYVTGTMLHVDGGQQFTGGL